MKTIFLALLLIVGLTACSPKVVCNDPYIQVGLECCLDRDSNRVCDRDESATPAEVQEVVAAHEQAKTEAAIEANITANLGPNCGTEPVEMDGKTFRSYSEFRAAAKAAGAPPEYLEAISTDAALQAQGMYVKDGVLYGVVCAGTS